MLFIIQNLHRICFFFLANFFITALLETDFGLKRAKEKKYLRIRNGKRNIHFILFFSEISQVNQVYVISGKAENEKNVQSFSAYKKIGP